MSRLLGRATRASLVLFLVVVGALGLSGSAWGATSPPRTLYVSSPSNPGKVSGFSISRSTGALSSINTAQGTAVQDVSSALSPDGKHLYSVALGSDVVDVYT